VSKRSSLLVLGFLLFAAQSRAAVGGGTDEALLRLARAAGQGDPVIRIGLEPGHAIEISSKRPFRVVDPATGDAIWKPRFEKSVRIVADGGPQDELPAIYRIQVGAFGNESAATQERERLEQALGVAAVVRHDPDRGNWRVRVGGSGDRLALTPLMEQLRGMGIEDGWIAEEPAEEISNVRLRLVDASFGSQLTELTRLAIVPASGGRIQVEKTSYRGILELRINEFGQVRPINWIELESYLLGVVPMELGPEVWPQLEALKAQAVAARTYLWRNRGQFEDQGYDLCATPRCQVYGGASAEHPLSDRAVWATRGEVLTWKNEPIVAYYTATCGGHTEDGDQIFPEERQPYLKGVPCRAENDALADLRATLVGHEVKPIEDETGADVTRDWALLSASGVIDTTQTPHKKLRATIDTALLRTWTERLAAESGLARPEGTPGPVDSLGSAATSLVADLGWEERSLVLLSGADLPALLRDDQATALPETQQRALAYLAMSETIRPFPDGRFHVDKRPTAARLIPALAHIGETYRSFGLREAVVSGVGEQSMRLVQGKGEIRLTIATKPFLFALTGGRPVPAERLEIWPGDRVRFRTDGQGRIDFLEVTPPVKGASDDRVAAVYSWEVRKTRRELEAAINRRVSVGRVTDLEVVRRGVSGRVVELRVVGTQSAATVRGFDVRRLLDLRESLLVIEVQRDAEGAIEAVVFAGKGWGHGIGLCQVGSYGMAVRGAKYSEILTHYYTGAELGRIAGSAR
jgi:stage II sporulation protein D